MFSKISIEFNKLMRWTMRETDLKKDKELGIDTVGYINWPRGVNLDYFRTESTSYKDLDLLIENYDLLENPQLVDYGSGKGRIIYYMNARLNIPVTGIEVNTVAFLDLFENYLKYKDRFPKNKKSIDVLEVPAEEYSVKAEDNIFYFFNPFTARIFEKVVENIKQSIKEKPRIVDIILYYPSYDYTLYLEKHTDFQLIQKINTHMYFINNRECFKVFRYIPNK